MKERYVLCFERDPDGHGHWECEGFLSREDKGIASTHVYGQSLEEAFSNVVRSLDFYLSGETPKESGMKADADPSVPRASIEERSFEHEFECILHVWDPIQGAFFDVVGKGPSERLAREALSDHLRRIVSVLHEPRNQ